MIREETGTEGIIFFFSLWGRDPSKHRRNLEGRMFSLDDFSKQTESHKKWNFKNGKNRVTAK